jgi:Tfp pilus assembly protein PilZ
LFELTSAVVAVGDPVNAGDAIVLLVNVSVPANVAKVPVVGKVIFVTPVLVNVVLKLPAVVKSLAVKILPPKLIVLVPLSTPVPP